LSNFSEPYRLTSRFIAPGSTRGALGNQPRPSRIARLRVARENVSRMLSEWRRRDPVTGSSRAHSLYDIAALKREMHPDG
jgi:hypothetical protein